MKLHGKGKTSFGQNIHIYLRISRNLEDEIFPKGVGVVTPKILFGFTQDLFLILEVLAFLFGLKTKYFSLEKNAF